MALKKCDDCGQELSSAAKACPHCGRPVKKPTSLLTWCIGAVMLYVIISAIMDSSDVGTPSPAAQARSARETALAATQLHVSSWHRGGFENVLLVDFEITNGNPQPVKDLKVTCTAFGKSETRVDSNTRVVYDVIPPKSKKAFKAFNMGLLHPQAHTLNCEIAALAL